VTSDQVLALCREAAEIGQELSRGGSLRTEEIMSMQTVFLGEIAYQLAVHNETEVATRIELTDAAYKLGCKHTQETLGTANASSPKTEPGTPEVTEK
jgi:hypothetical protein